MSQMEIKNITKKFADVTALDNVTLKLEENKIYGLLGRNGAGKTTLLNLITNRIFPTDGEILVDGESVIENDSALSKLYFMTENNYYPEHMTVKKAFTWTKEFYTDFDIEYATELCEKFSLKLRQKIKTLSTGYTSIFKMILALSCNVPFVLLDEPVLGLDANHRDLFYKELLKNYSEKPKTIVISTHLIEEAAEIIEDVIIIKSGKMILKESVESVLSQGYAITGSISAVDSFTAGKNVLGADTIGGLKSAYILGHLDKSGIPEGLEVTKPDLQKLFIHMTNR